LNDVEVPPIVIWARGGTQKLETAEAIDPNRE
jgi:hypothetical protein